MKKLHWTEEEIDVLKQYYADASVSKENLLKKLPRRSWESIQHKVKRLGAARAPITRFLKPAQIGKLSRDDTLYLAGLLDGEGMITISVRRGKKTIKRRVYERVGLTPIISFTNSCKDLIDWLTSILKGSTLKSPYEKGDKWKVVYTLQVARLLDIKSFLEQILPFLKVKKKQAELVLEFCDLRLKDKWREYNPRLFEIAKEVRRLNKKGKKSSA